MPNPNWSRRLNTLIAGYKKCLYTPLELKCAALDLMPVDCAADVVGRLPGEVAELLRRWAYDASSWSEKDWASVIRIQGPPPTWAEIQETRAKCAALRAYFDAVPGSA
jgi:hypothetical protein